MSKTRQNIELTANVLLIVVSLVVIALLGQRFLFPGRLKLPEHRNPIVGTQVAGISTDWASKPKNVLLVMQQGCHFCEDSAAFYKRLIHDTEERNVKITAVLPQPTEISIPYLKSLGLDGIETKQAQLASLNVSGTPTLIIANDKGEISNVWVGRLPPEKEAEVLQNLQ